MKRGSPDRDWKDAVAKCEEEGCCRVCRIERGLECAHLAKREHDRPKPNMRRRYVHPDNVIPLCQPDHQAFDAGELDVLEFLSVEEQVHVVRVLGGIEPARMRLAALDYRRDIQQARIEARLAA